jgi:hypothetical protein
MTKKFQQMARKSTLKLSEGGDNINLISNLQLAATRKKIDAEMVGGWG